MKTLEDLRKLAEEIAGKYFQLTGHAPELDKIIFERQLVYKDIIELMLFFHEQASKNMFEEEFVEWILAGNITYGNGIIDYESGKRWFRTFDELYQYWQTNIKDK